MKSYYVEKLEIRRANAWGKMSELLKGFGLTKEQMFEVQEEANSVARADWDIGWEKGYDAASK